MAADDVLDHGREHLEAIVTDDHALDAGIQIHKAVLVHVADIAGVCPDLAVCMAAQDHVGLLGLIVVALHDGGGADADLAALPMGSSVSVPGSKMDTTVFSMGMPTLPGLVTLPAATVAAEATSVMP